MQLKTLANSSFFLYSGFAFGSFTSKVSRENIKYSMAVVQILIKYWQNTDQILMKYWTITSQILIKKYSNTDQELIKSNCLLIKYWSNTILILIKCLINFWTRQILKICMFHIFCSNINPAYPCHVHIRILKICGW